MRVIAIRTLRQHWEKPGRGDSREPLEAWYAEATSVIWKNFGDIKKTSATASVVANNRVIFNIGGNKYRLIVKIHYNTGIIFIRFVGTHEEYDQIDANTI